MPNRFRVFPGGPGRVDLATPATGERTILGIPYRVAIWTEAQWRATPEADRPRDVTQVGPYRIGLATDERPRHRAEASGRV